MRYAAVGLLVASLMAIKVCDGGEPVEESARAPAATTDDKCDRASATAPESATATRLCPSRVAPSTAKPTASSVVSAPVPIEAFRRWEAEATAGAARLALGARKSLPLSVGVAPTCSTGFLDRAADALAGDEAGVLLEAHALACEGRATGRTTLARAFLPRDIKAHPLRLSLPVAPFAKPCVVRISLCAAKSRRGDATCGASDTVVASRVAWLDATSFVLLEDQASYRTPASLASALRPLLGNDLARTIAAGTPQTNHNLNASLSSAGVALTIGAYHAGACRPRTKGKP